MPATCRSSTTITDLALASAVVARAGPLAADRPSASSQLPQTALQRPGIVDSSAIGADREPGDAPVHPDHRTLNGRRVWPVDLHGQRAVPAVSLLPAGGRQDPPIKLAGRLLGGYPADPGQHDRAILDPDRAGQAEPLRAAAAFLPPGQTDPPAARAATPGVGVGPIQVTQRFLGGALGHLVQPAV